MNKESEKRYFQKDGAIDALGEWAMEFVRDDCRAMIILDSPTSTRSLTFTATKLDQEDRLKIALSGVGAILSDARDAEHFEREFEK